MVVSCVSSDSALGQSFAAWAACTWVMSAFSDWAWAFCNFAWVAVIGAAVSAATVAANYRIGDKPEYQRVSIHTVAPGTVLLVLAKIKPITSRLTTSMNSTVPAMTRRLQPMEYSE